MGLLRASIHNEAAAESTITSPSRLKRRRLSLEEGEQHANKHYYRVDLLAQERGMPQTSGTQPLQLVAVPPLQLGHGTTQYDSSSAVLLPPPSHELSFQDINPVPETIWSYTVSLGMALVLWLLYLLTPRGFRKKYCLASRKRYARRTDGDMPPGGYWMPANQSVSDAGGGSKALPQRPNVIHTQGSSTNPPPLLQASSTMSSMEGSYPLGTPKEAVGKSTSPRNSNNPPSPEHPALKKIPPNRIIAETMGRLQGRGIRLVAHGVHCDAKRVWIKLDDETKAVTWQTEFPRRVPNQSGQVSIVLMRGSVHRIALTNVLYIDVGKKTNALQRLDETKVPDPSCFSLLTQNGSLDLQANSKLERDALVSCFSMILDDVHANEDWRALYEASPDPSLANSSVGNGNSAPTASTGGIGRAAVSARPNMGPPPSAGRPNGTTSTPNYPNPSDMLVEV